LAALMAMLAALLAVASRGAPAFAAEVSESAPTDAIQDGADDDDEELVGAQYLREFTVVNNTTSKTLKFLRWSSLPAWQGPYFDQLPAPSPGATWSGGRKNVFSLTVKPFIQNGARMTYSLGTAIVEIDVMVDGVGVQHGTCAITDPSLRCANDGGWFSVASATPQTTIIGPEQAELQQQTLEEMCGNPDVLASCSFEVDEVTTTLGPRIIVEETVHVNCRLSSEDSVDERFQREVGGSSSISISGEVGFNLFGVVNAGLSVGHQVSASWSHTYVISHSLKIPPRSVGWIDYYPPVLRILGDFTVRIGDDALVVSGVSYDTPLVDRNNLGKPVTREDPLTADEISRLCETGRPVLP
jgi:hypothetical protein